MLESLWPILATFELCVLAMLRACEQGTVKSWVLQGVVGMFASVDTEVSFDNRLLYTNGLLAITKIPFGTRLLFNIGYPAFAFASVRYDLASEELWLVGNATCLI